MIVEAIPASVNLTEISENETPRNGQKNAPIEVRTIPDLFLVAFTIFLHLESTVVRTVTSLKTEIEKLRKRQCETTS
jgi:hypothetical protein